MSNIQNQERQQFITNVYPHIYDLKEAPTFNDNNNIVFLPDKIPFEQIDEKISFIKFRFNEKLKYKEYLGTSNPKYRFNTQIDMPAIQAKLTKESDTVAVLILQIPKKITKEFQSLPSYIILQPQNSDPNQF